MPSRTVNVHEAKTHLSRLLEEVEHGGEITIARAGVPCARLVPLIKAARREIGFFDRDIPDSVLFEPVSEEDLCAWDAASDRLFTLDQERADAPAS